MIQVDGIFVQQGGGGPVFPEFTYTGDYYIVNEGTPDWKIYFTSSGTFTPASNIAVQAQLIGGGSGGNSGGYSYARRIGGGGGESVVNDFILEATKGYDLIIGAGGYGGAGNQKGGDGGITYGFGVSAAGGVSGISVDVFEFGDTSGIRQSGRGGDGGASFSGSNGQNAGNIDPNIGGGKGGKGGNNSEAGGAGNFGSKGGNGATGSGGGGGGGGYGGGGGGGAYNSAFNDYGSGGVGAPGVIIMRNTRLSA